MESISFTLAAHSTFFKPKPSSSKDSEIFVDIKSFEYLKAAVTGRDLKGRDVINVIIHKEDCMRAIGNITNSLPLYTSKNGVCRKEANANEVYNNLSLKVSSFFGLSDKMLLTDLYLTDLQGRKYIWGTEGRNAKFELRKFFIANHTILTFSYDNSQLVLRFHTHLVR